MQGAIRFLSQFRTTMQPSVPSGSVVGRLPTCVTVYAFNQVYFSKKKSPRGDGGQRGSKKRSDEVGEWLLRVFTDLSEVPQTFLEFLRLSTGSLATAQPSACTL